MNKKIYVCLNTLVKDSETEEFFRLVKGACDSGADAIIMQDLFLGEAIKRQCPEVCLHLSTQAGCCNEYGAKLAAECGFSRVVLARETPIGEIEKISKILPTEVFVQGALCSGFSGQCYFSSFVGGNSGNRGRCKQPCRKKYAIDRKGFEDFAYAISPADLCIGERIWELLKAGVSSLKIEGRMRRSEYVASAVNYYRTLLYGGDKDAAFSDLRRAYNRGDYTRGLAFGGERFLSRKVQGHIGERVGILEKGDFCRSAYPAKAGDGFKILRQGKEVGGATFKKSGKGGFYLSTRDSLKVGDEVRLTTDSGLPLRIPQIRRKISLSIDFSAGKPSRIEAEGFIFEGIAPERAQRAPISCEALKECFSKTGENPFEVTFSKVIANDAFLPMSALNELRRNFYRELRAYLLPKRKKLSLDMPKKFLTKGEERRTAVICSDGSKVQHGDENLDILILKPRDYSDISLPKGRGELFLFLPPFFTGKDLKIIEEKLPLFDGIYCDGYYGLALAREHGMRFFAGTGWNLTNKYSVAAARERSDLVALSKELDAGQQDALSGENTFVLGGGAIKLMDLCYCPFERRCPSCDMREFYTLTDEGGRKFPLRRFRAGDCRFELFNCDPLVENPVSAGKLLDLTCSLSTPPTKGHLKRSML